MKGIWTGIQNLINIIQTIVDGILMAIQFLINLVKSMIEMIKLLATTILNLTTLEGTLPIWLVGFVTATIGVSVLYLLIGRETGK